MEILQYSAHFFLLVLLIISTPSSAKPEIDHSALLGIKSRIKGDPLGILSTWNDSLHHCDWQGITCSGGRVSTLVLSSQKLQGTLAPHIGNLTFLERIDLAMNNFYGEIPQEISLLVRLQELYLTNNSFGGNIPMNISHCSVLRAIGLDRNQLSGNISVLASLTKLELLYLAKNDFIGYIPPSLGNLSSLTHLSLPWNHLEGSIPDELCHLRNLNFFQLGVNNLTGKLPACLYNQSKLDFFGVTANQLEGTLPTDLGLTLPYIREIYLGGNKFSGVIPFSLSNSTRLETISFDGNHFTGSVPDDLGKLQSLGKLWINSNNLGTDIGDDLKFITSLNNCSLLDSLDIHDNSLKGPFPDSISNMSTSLRFFFAGRNQIHGTIPVGIINLINLEGIYIEWNQLTGEIPPFIGNMNKVEIISLQGNMLSGRLPTSLGNLTQLRTLELSFNNFNGSIPPKLGNCTRMEFLSLAHNSLIGGIPGQLTGLSFLTLGIRLHKNFLTGPLPSQVGNWESLTQLSISDNKLSGRIPESLGKCFNLIDIYMQNNLFEGSIPETLNTLRGLEYIDLSINNLSGEIPRYLETFPLVHVNLSFNQLEGAVPSNGVFRDASLISVSPNKNLCGGIKELKLPPCVQKKKKSFSPVKVIIPVTVGSLSLVALLCFFFLFHRRRTLKRNPSSTTLFDQPYKRLSYLELLKATNGFSKENLIGVGSYGSLFRGVLQEINQVVAVKVLNLARQGASKSFLTECNALRNLRHRNLVKIVTACSSVDSLGNDFKALVFQFIPNGSLEEWLHPSADDNGSRSLSFIQRLNIAIDVATALEYLHHMCEPQVVHCDLKPSNVLLDDDMVARVADFGVAKIFSVTSYDSSQTISSSVVIKGSIGYVPPEYGMGNEVSKQGDAYSYGILLLEMFTGKKPTDEIFQNGLNLHNYAKTALPDQVMDPALLLEKTDAVLSPSGYSKPRLEGLASTIQLGIACSAELPGERMTMDKVIMELHHIKDSVTLLTAM